MHIEIQREKAKQLMHSIITSGCRIEGGLNDIVVNREEHWVNDVYRSQI
jgi:hypothetical protein